MGTIDFFTTYTLERLPDRMEALRSVGRLVSAAMDGIAQSDIAHQKSEQIMAAASMTTQGAHSARVASEAMASLEAGAVEIGKVVKLIKTITQQTNLLVLNATIEAARAGVTRAKALLWWQVR